MRSLNLNLFLASLAAFCVFVCAAPGHAAPRPASQRHAPAHPASLHSVTPARRSRLPACPIQEMHVYLTDDGAVTPANAMGAAAPVDVTKTLYIADGQTYAVLNGKSIAIVLDYNSGNVYSTAGRSIGFMALLAAQTEVTAASVLAAL